MSDIEILTTLISFELERWFEISSSGLNHTFIPSSEKHGGTAELSSSASLSRTGNFSTADIGMSPR